MPNMSILKFLLATLFLIYFTGSLTAQTYVKSYYISMTGDTVRGTALTGSYSVMSKEIRFKSQIGEIIILKPEEVRAVWLSPDKYFESKNIHFRNLSNELDGSYFLRLLVKKDDIYLLKFEYSQYQGFYIQKKEGMVTPLLSFTDYVWDQKDNFRKKEVRATDTLSHSDQVKVFDIVGEYKIRKAYLFTLRQFFNNCDDKIVNSTYRLNDKDIIKAFHELANCLGTKSKTIDYFKESSWQPSVGVTVNHQTSSKNFSYASPIGMGIFLNYSDFRDGIGLGINWLRAISEQTAILRPSGSFIEYALFYNRKVFIRPKFNAAIIAGISLLRNKNLSLTDTIQSTPNIIVTKIPFEQHHYGIIGVSVGYQFFQNNYLNLQFQRNMFFNVLSSTTYFDRLQVQYEYRF